MTTINPYMAAAHRSPDLFRMRAMEARQITSDEERAKYLATAHKFELYNGQDATGEIEMMTGQDALQTNNELTAIFGKEIGKEIDAGVPFGKTSSKRARWLIVKRDVEL
jgi:hypothetical protein